MMSEQPLVSIITPVYNGAKYIEELILSVKEQDYRNIEHIIIDDGSDDEGATVAILEKYPHLRWWSRPNKGQYATMNEGLEAARGAVICFISADDLLAKGAVNIATQYLAANPDKDGVYGDYEHINNQSEVIRPLRPFRNAPTVFYPYSLHISHSSLYLNKRALTEKNFKFDSSLKYVGDYDWIVRILSQMRLGRTHQVFSLIRLHSDQTTNVSIIAMRTEMIEVQRKSDISVFWASMFRKIMFFSNLLTTSRDTGIKDAIALIFKRISGKNI
jgi:glycosyltransferase involved in cell wall biosynthesis